MIYNNHYNHPRNPDLLRKLSTSDIGWLNRSFFFSKKKQVPDSGFPFGDPQELDDRNHMETSEYTETIYRSTEMDTDTDRSIDRSILINHCRKCGVISDCPRFFEGFPVFPKASWTTKPPQAASELASFDMKVQALPWRAFWAVPARTMGVPAKSLDGLWKMDNPKSKNG